MTDYKSWEDRLYPSLIPNIEYIVKNTPINGVFYDIGANTGLLTEKVLDQRPDITAVLFEPVKKYYDSIDAKFKNNNKVSYFNCALVDEKKELRISLSIENLGYNTLTTIKEYETTEKVEGDTLSNIVSEYNIPYPDLVKIDVEESEFLVIKGCKEFFKTHKPRKIIIECGVPGNEYLKKEREEMLSYLIGLGYAMYDYDPSICCDVKFYNTDYENSFCV